MSHAGGVQTGDASHAVAFGSATFTLNSPQSLNGEPAYSRISICLQTDRIECCSCFRFAAPLSSARTQRSRSPHARLSTCIVRTETLSQASASNVHQSYCGRLG